MTDISARISNSSSRFLCAGRRITAAGSARTRPIAMQVGPRQSMSHLGGNDEVVSTASLPQPRADELLSLSTVRGSHRCGVDLGSVYEIPAFACEQRFLTLQLRVSPVLHALWQIQLYRLGEWTYRLKRNGPCGTLCTLCCSLQSQAVAHATDRCHVPGQHDRGQPGSCLHDAVVP